MYHIYSVLISAYRLGMAMNASALCRAWKIFVFSLIKRNFSDLMYACAWRSRCFPRFKSHTIV